MHNRQSFILALSLSSWFKQLGAELTQDALHFSTLMSVVPNVFLAGDGLVRIIPNGPAPLWHKVFTSSHEVFCLRLFCGYFFGKLLAYQVTTQLWVCF